MGYIINIVRHGDFDMDIDKINRLRAWAALGAEALDSYRIVPRTILVLYGWFVYRIGMWFMSLPSPDTQQAAFVGTVFGAAAIIIGLYNSSGKDWGHQGFKVWPFKAPTLVEESDK